MTCPTLPVAACVFAPVSLCGKWTKQQRCVTSVSNSWVTSAGSCKTVENIIFLCPRREEFDVVLLASILEFLSLVFLHYIFVSSWLNRCKYSMCYNLGLQYIHWIVKKDFLKNGFQFQLRYFQSHQAVFSSFCCWTQKWTREASVLLHAWKGYMRQCCSLTDDLSRVLSHLSHIADCPGQSRSISVVLND